jgi:3-oxoacyl-[acyl-carrier-protein] synthase-1
VLRKNLVGTPVILSALGIVNALGSDCVSVAERLFAGDQSRIRRIAGFIPDRDCFVGAVDNPLPAPPDGMVSLWSRNAALSWVALQQIEDAVTGAIDRYGPHRVGVVLGSSTSGIDQGEAAIRGRNQDGKLPAGYSYRQQQMGAVSDVISELTGALGPSYTISTACSSSAKVFRAALNLIRSGICDCVITGGFDSLCKLTLNGFSALELVSDEITNPFSRNRKGISIGEGGALFLLERAELTSLTDQSVCVCGVGESSDAYHISSPDPEAKGAIAAIRSAVSHAGVSVDAIDYVNLHGTGTLHNDAMESRAMRAVFPESVPASSTKPLVGHMLGASGATEVAFCWMALRDPQRRLPPHIFDGVLDPDLPPIRFVSLGERSETPPRFVLSNSFGFGGSNCAVVLGRGDCVRAL